MAEPATTEQNNLPDVDALIKSVRDWPAMQRLKLAQAILKTLEPVIEPRRQRKVTAAEATGLLAGERPAPNDAEVDALIAEYLSEKYG